MEINPTMPSKLKKTLMDNLELSEKDVYTVDGLLDLKDLMSFLGLPLPHLKDPTWTSTMPPRLRHYGDELRIPDLNENNKIDFFEVIRQKDLLLHHPYHSFASTVQGFISQAAHDPNVLAIKMTLYRTSGNSPIVNALIAAAENDKQVAVLVELKARFDEENNIQWARKLEQYGVCLLYTSPSPRDGLLSRMPSSA